MLRYQISSLSLGPRLFPIPRLPSHLSRPLQATVAWMDWLGTWLICNPSCRIRALSVLLYLSYFATIFASVVVMQTASSSIGSSPKVSIIAWNRPAVQELAPLSWSDSAKDVDFGFVPTISHQYAMPLPSIHGVGAARFLPWLPHLKSHRSVLHRSCHQTGFIH